MSSTPDPDFAREVVADLYRYRRKRVPVARGYHLTLGILGAHQFYLGRPLWGLIYLLTAGGALVLWIMDFFRLQALVQAHNTLEAEREKAGLPPQSLAFLPPVAKLELNAPPAWAERRGSRSVLVGGTALSALLAFAMGTVSGSIDLREPVVIALAFIAVTLVAARWPGMRRIPVLAQLSRWNHRLRLYYHTTDPGSVWLLASRPVFGLFLAPWQQKARAEVRLYLQLGVAFGIAFVAFDLYELRGQGFWRWFGLQLAELAQTVVYTYVFVAPIGAIVLTQQLIARKDWIVMLMCALILSAGYLGMRIVGGV